MKAPPLQMLPRGCFSRSGQATEPNSYAIAPFVQCHIIAGNNDSEVLRSFDYLEGAGPKEPADERGANGIMSFSRQVGWRYRVPSSQLTQDRISTRAKDAFCSR